MTKLTRSWSCNLHTFSHRYVTFAPHSPQRSTSGKQQNFSLSFSLSSLFQTLFQLPSISPRQEYTKQVQRTHLVLLSLAFPQYARGFVVVTDGCAGSLSSCIFHHLACQGRLPHGARIITVLHSHKRTNTHSLTRIAPRPLRCTEPGPRC